MPLKLGTMAEVRRHFFMSFTSLSLIAFHFSGSSNNGNLARAALGEHKQVLANLTLFPVEIIQRLEYIWITIKSHFYVNPDEFYNYCQETKNMWLQSSISWYPTCATLHKVHEHGADCLRICNVPPGLLSEENSEAVNKMLKRMRLNHTGLNALENSLLHPFKRQILRTNPRIQEIILKYRPEPTPQKSDLPVAVQNLLMN